MNLALAILSGYDNLLAGCKALMTRQHNYGYAFSSFMPFALQSGLLATNRDKGEVQ
jgi:hypothetical protein